MISCGLKCSNKGNIVKYPKKPDFENLTNSIAYYSELKHEYGAKGVKAILAKTEKSLKQAVAELKKLPVDKTLAEKEPNDLAKILSLRPKGPRKIWQSFDRTTYLDKVEGAMLGRLAGCTLGAPVEFYSIEKMRNLAKENGEPFPPVDYWSYVPDPFTKRYLKSRRESYTSGKMKSVPVDDDIIYMIVGLLVVEEFGLDFTTADVAAVWDKYLPIAYTAEKVALENIRANVPIDRVAEKNNPFCQWIGAYIRADAWGYIAAGWPEKAAEFAYRDAYLSHRRQGIYGEMFFAAAIAAAFTVDDPMEALKIGLTEIPTQCRLAKTIKWAIKTAPSIKNYKDARNAVAERFTQTRPDRGGFDLPYYTGMSPVHTLNNACLVVWGIAIGGTDFSRVISETVAMGLDNDCNAATAGSIVGAVIGKEKIPSHWYVNFNNKVESYLKGKNKFTISGLVKRFARQAAKLQCVYR